MWSGWGSLAAALEPCLRLLLQSRALVIDASPLEGPKSGHFGSYLWRRTQISDILCPSSGKGPKLGHSVSFHWKDPNQDILGPPSGKGSMPGYFGSLLWKKTQAGIFCILSLEKDPNRDILGPSSVKGPKLEHFGSLLWKDLTQDVLTPQAALWAPFFCMNLHSFC